MGGGSLARPVHNKVEAKVKIYFAGVPAGNQSHREHHLRDCKIENRLITVFYKRQALITLDNFLESHEGIFRDTKRKA